LENIMRLKQSLTLLAAMLPLLGSGLAGATPMEITSFTDVKSWGSNNELIGGTGPGTYNITKTFTSVTSEPDGYTLETIDFSGSASAVTTWGTAGGQLFVEILYGATGLGSFQLGSGDYFLGNNEPFTGSLDVADALVTAGGSLSFRFYESLSDVALFEGESFSEDAIWNSIGFNLNGTPIPFSCTAHPNDPSCTTGGGGGGGGTVPEPATLALLGLGLVGLGAMRRRAR